MAAHSSRRSFTAITGLAALGAAVGATFGSTLGLGVRTAQADDSTTSPPPTPAAAPTRALRFAHCTDIHMTPNTNAFEGTARALNTRVRSSSDANVRIAPIVTQADVVTRQVLPDECCLKEERLLY